MGQVQVESIGGSFAYEVKGLRLWEELPQAVADELAAMWSSHGVLVFRRQALSEDELVAFSRRFGQPEVIVRTDWQGYRPEVIQISNMRNQAGKAIGGLGAGELGWHSDQSYVADPATGSVLYMVEKTPDGGRTYWANLQLAYDALPPALKEAVEGKEAVFDYLKRQSTYDDEKPMSQELRRKTPPIAHPLVTVHPRTRRKSLYLDPTTTVGVVGLSEREGADLLATLNAHATRPEFVYAHTWQIGDVVMWDNGFLLHRRDEFDPSQNRWLKRTTLKLRPDRHIVPRTTAVIEEAA